MQEFLNFVIEHWLLWTIFFVLLLLIIINELRLKLLTAAQLSPQDAVQLMNRENANVIDIRSEDLYKKGHIIGAKNIEPADLENKLNKLQKIKSKPIIVVDSNGQQSLNPAKILKNNGFEKVYTLQGGIGAWQNASLPLTTKGSDND